jgi:hypothetical protein
MMTLVNTTAHPATLLRAQTVYADLMLGTLVVKASWAVDDHGRCVRVEDPAPLAADDLQTPYGAIDGDLVPAKDGCDVVIAGPAVVAPPGRTTAVMDVEVDVGPLRRRLRVHGDRTWVRAGGALVASAPVPFAAMPLDWSRAYGGEARLVPEVRGPYAPNPLGRGFVALEEDVEGTPLPNVEEVDQLVRTWRDRPLPASLMPPPRHSDLRGASGIAVDVEAETVQVGPGAFRASHPRSRMVTYPGGAPVEIRGMSDDGRMAFTLPRLALRAEVALGGRVHVLDVVPDTVVIFPRHRRLFVVARRSFVYQIVPLRERITTLAEGTGEPPATTLARELAGGRPCVPVVGDPGLALPLDLVRSIHPLTALVESLPLCASA